MQKKTREETIKAYKNYNKPIEFLYNEKFVNWSGKTKDSNEYYSEIIASELLKNLSIFDTIHQISRTNGYKINDHTKIVIDLTSHRREEIFAKRLAYIKLEYLGEILDYQIPLKSTQKDKLGKIDLASFNKDTKNFHLIELKYDDNKETLLRTALEIFTYSRLVDKNKLLKDYLHKDYKFIFNNYYQNEIDLDTIQVVPTVLITEKCNCFDELEEMELSERPKLKALSLALDIKYFTINLPITPYES